MGVGFFEGMTSGNREGDNIFNTEGDTYSNGFSDFMGSNFWANKGLNPLVNFNFTLQVEGIYNLPCKSVRVFQRENEYEYLQEGGLNDYVHMLRKPISKPMTFQVERYVGVDMLDPLALGTDLVLPVLLSVSRYQGEGASGGWEQPQRIYTFTGCSVIAKEFGELNAERSGLLVETTTISYREMLCLDNPSTGMKTKAPYAFKKSEKKGNTENKYARVLKTQASKQDWEEKAQMYVDAKGTPKDPYLSKYKGKQITEGLASHVTGERRKADMEARAQMYVDPEAWGQYQSQYKGLKVTEGFAEKNYEPSKKDMEARAQMYVDPNVKKQPDYIKNYKGRKIKTTQGVAGLAAKNQMTSKADREKEARMYVDPSLKNKPAHVANYKGKKITYSYNRTAGGKIVGLAAKMPMSTQREMEKNARRYFLPGSKAAMRYRGTEQASAQLNADELRRKEMEQRAALWKMDGSGTASAKVNENEEKQVDLEKKANRYFLPGSRGAALYAGTIKNSAKTNQDEPKRADWEAKAVRWKMDGSGKASAQVNKDEAKRADWEAKAVRWKMDGSGKTSAVTSQNQLSKNEMETKAKRYYLPKGSKELPHKGIVQTSAKTRENEPRRNEMEAKAKRYYLPGGKRELSHAGKVQSSAITQGNEPRKNAMALKAKRYYLPGGKRELSHAGKVQASAVTPKNQLSKSAMEAKANKWPTTRSAAEVTKFLKKK